MLSHTAIYGLAHMAIITLPMNRIADNASCLRSITVLSYFDLECSFTVSEVSNVPDSPEVAGYFPAPPVEIVKLIEFVQTPPVKGYLPPNPLKGEAPGDGFGSVAHVSIAQDRYS